MKRYEFSAFVTVNAETEAEAQELAESLVDASSKDPDGAHVSLDDSPPYEEECE